MDQPIPAFVYDSAVRRPLVYDGAFVFGGADPRPTACDAATLPVNMTYDASGFLFENTHRAVRLDVQPEQGNASSNANPEADEPMIVERNEKPKEV